MVFRKVDRWIPSIVFSSPRLMGWLVFATLLMLTLFLSFAEYQLKLSEEREKVNLKLNEVEKTLENALSDGISAAKTLGIFAQYQDDLIQNFDTIAEQILESNALVDAIQFLDSGTIVAIYPLAGNEKAIGYDLLKDSSKREDVLESIRRKEVYFAGPFRLVQGGIAIIGRYPFFEKGKLKGLSASVILFDKLLESESFNQKNLEDFEVQLSKSRSDSGVVESFVHGPSSEKPTGHTSSVFLPIGDWSLSVQLKKSTALQDVYWMLTLGLFVSSFLGIAAWNSARQPLLLRKKLAEQSQEILLANERFELASNATSDVIWDWDISTGKVYRSEHFFFLLGYDVNSATSNSSFWQSIIHPEDEKKVNDRLSDTLDGADRYWSQEFRVRKADDTYAYVIDKGYIIRNSEGKAIRMIGAIQDISIRKAAERELIELNQRLSRANEELRVFASLASHDLREPLRMISSFMSLLEKKYGPTLDQKANQYISFAIDGAKRLSILINDLLEYSKVGFDPGLIEDIDTNRLVQEVLKLKAFLLTENKAVVKVENLPPIKGIRIPIQVLLQNLIGNALKYSRQGVNPEITLSGRESKDFWEFSIADNGIGIEADYLEFIFGLSKRLHSKEKYPGNGMGLATCRKIITQHGGKIWVESTPGEGSTFLFTIRKRG